MKAGYRRLSNPAVNLQAIGEPHRRQTLRRCVGHPVILIPADDSLLSFSTRSVVRGLGPVNDGGQGFVQHPSLAVYPDGALLGVVDQGWFNRVEASAGETRGQRLGRWRETDVWSEAVRRIGVGPEGTRLIHVMDRAADSMEIIRTCMAVGVGFIIRAKHDRRVEGGTTQLGQHLERQAAAGTLKVTIGTQRDARGRIVRRGREAEVTVWFSRVQLEPPWNHPGPKEPQAVRAVYLREEQPPAGAEPVEWMLLTNEPVERFETACRIIDWYQHRWIIEEWHRAEKEGCRLEASQLDDAEDLKRLAATVGIIAVRLLQLRDLAGECVLADEIPQEKVPVAETLEADVAVSQANAGQSKARRRAHDPAALQAAVPSLWIMVVAALASVPPDRLTPQLFWRQIARQGGWLGRKADGRPGWKTIWRGWYDTELMARGAELQSRLTQTRCNCG